MKKEGFRQMYRGILPPLFQRSSEISVMFGMYKTAEVRLRPLELSTNEEILASSIISGLAESILTPFERTQLLLMDSKYNDRFRNTGHAVLVQIKHYGLKELYRGFTVISIRNVFHNTCFFASKERMSKFVNEFEQIGMSTKHFITGATVGLTMTCVFYPLKVIKTIIQKDLGGRFRVGALRMQVTSIFVIRFKSTPTN
ncbi:hypothetical protein ABEB36_000582 [Hypothenemus hampei]|uniref:Uncharacterized protein n=1 Tax=Hypothenemus hampei TaxID=57062 RepID=A0ABD1FBP6_HYPHA